MKKSIILILTIIFFFETATSANNIVFIDMDKILSSSICYLARVIELK